MAYERLHNQRRVFRIEAERLCDENLELRNLVREMGHVLFSLDVDYCGACNYDNRLYPCPVFMSCDGECKFKTAMRELGIEVRHV